MGFSRMTRFFVIRALDFTAKMSGNLGFGRNPNVSNCPGLPFLLEGPRCRTGTRGTLGRDFETPGILCSNLAEIP